MYHLFLICSAIQTNNKPLNYHPRRSVFTHEERFKQTLETIHSIRVKVPNAYIVLIEVTPLKEQFQSILEKKVNYLFKTHTIPEVFEITEGPLKGLGEITSLYYYLMSDHFKEHRHQFGSLSKISGRYKLLEKFLFEVHDQNMIALIRPYKHNYGTLDMSTMFYTVPSKLFNYFIIACQLCSKHVGLLEGHSLESIFPGCLQEAGIPIYLKTPLYVGGEVGPWGGFVMH